jgi:futalosine hydrolase
MVLVALSEKGYDLALNLGVCGSFDPQIELAGVVHVITDGIPEIGAEDDGQFLTVEEIKLVEKDEFPFTRGRLINRSPAKSAMLVTLPTVDGITVNTVHGTERSIAEVVNRFHPQVESMEGAAFMYTCLIHRIPFAQVRAVSNFVEKRNREVWKLTEAIHNLTAVALKVLEDV